MEIRDARESDFGPITAIYNEAVLHSTATYNDRPATCEEREALWQARLEHGYPTLAALDGDIVTGFGTFGDFRAWPGYRYTVEVTIYVGEGMRGKRVGSALLGALGKRTMIAAVDAENEASLRFFERHGFERAGLLREVGNKFGRFLDLVLLQYWINERNP